MRLALVLIATVMLLGGCSSEQPEPASFKKPPPPSQRLPKPPVDKGN